MLNEHHHLDSEEEMPVLNMNFNAGGSGPLQGLLYETRHDAENVEDGYEEDGIDSDSIQQHDDTGMTTRPNESPTMRQRRKW